jgi:hypothetical protein
MRKGGKPARLKLFAQLEADLRRNVIGKQGVILCPLCLGEFGVRLDRGFKQGTKMKGSAEQHNSGERPMRIRLMTGLRREDFLAAVAKAAYLGLFVYRGYSYILQPSLDPIRKAIREEDGVDRSRLSNVILPCQISGFSELPGAPDRLTFETHSLGGVPVCLSLINLKNSSGAARVVLPPGVAPNTGSWDGLARGARSFMARTIW